MHTSNVCLKKCIPVKIILKNLIQRKRLSIYLLVIHCSQIVHLMKRKTNLIVTEAKPCMERFCKDLKYHAMKIFNYEEKEMIPLTDKENKSYQMQKVCYICKEEFSTDNDKSIIKSEIIVIPLENIEELLIIFII